MDEVRLREEVTVAYQAYIRAFLANDIVAIDALVRYPLAYLGNGEVRLVDSYPVQPAALMAEKQWHTSTDMHFQVAAISPSKAHVILTGAKRRHADGSLIETASAFYAFTYTEMGWKMFAFSDVTVAAEA